MHPLQVGHLRFLHELDSPFVAGGSADLEDLILAAFVCAQSHTSARRSVGKWWAVPLIRFWAWACVRTKVIWTHEAARLRGYVADSFDLSRVKRSGGDGKEVSSPIHARLYNMLRGELDMTHTEAMNLTVKEAVDAWISLAEDKGAVELWSDRELAHFKFHEQAEAEWLAAQGKN